LKPRIKFFIDECVPDSVGKFLTASGHEVTYLRDVLPRGSPDPIVAAASEQSGAVLVTFIGISTRWRAELAANAYVLKSSAAYF